MIATRQRRRRRTVRRRPETRRLRRRTGLALALVLTAALALATYRSGSGPAPPPTLAAASSASTAPDGQPAVETMASYGSAQGLVLRVPVRQQRITAIVYHGIGDANVVPLQPAGKQLNAGFLSRLSDRLFGGSSSPGPRYYVDSGDAGPDTGSVDVGAAAGTLVWSPVDGVVASIRPYELSGKRYGSVIQIRPDAAPAVTITLQSVTPLKTRPVQVGDEVTAARTPLGTIVDLSGVLEQTVARYTSDAGNHVSISIGPSPGASPIL